MPNDEEHGIAIYTKDQSYIVLHFTKPLQLIQMPKETAAELAKNILEAVDMLEVADGDT